MASFTCHFYGSKSKQTKEMLIQSEVFLQNLAFLELICAYSGVSDFLEENPFVRDLPNFPFAT